MMPLALGDSVWIAGIAATQVVALAIIVPLMAIYLERVKKAIEKAADEAAVKVKEVKVTLEDSTGVVNEKLDTIAKTTGENTKTTDKIHTLVNSAMGAPNFAWRPWLCGELPAPRTARPRTRWLQM